MLDDVHVVARDVERGHVGGGLESLAAGGALLITPEGVRQLLWPHLGCAAADLAGVRQLVDYLVGNLLVVLIDLVDFSLIRNH